MSKYIEKSQKLQKLLARSIKPTLQLKYLDNEVQNRFQINAIKKPFAFKIM